MVVKEFLKINFSVILLRHKPVNEQTDVKT